MTGLGALLQAYGNSFRMDRYLAVVLTYAAIGTVFTGLLSLLENRLSPPSRRRYLA
jgi:ABC-type nitrate/sulfonate/bicarbonate transport system permease component